MPHPPSKQDRTVGAVFIKGFASSPTETTREQLSFHARHIHRPNKIVRLDPFSSRDLLLFRRDSAGAALLSRASFCPVLCQQRRSQRIQIYGRVPHGAMWPNRAFFLQQLALHPLIQVTKHYLRFFYIRSYKPFKHHFFFLKYSFTQPASLQPGCVMPWMTSDEFYSIGKHGTVHQASPCLRSNIEY
jgi:hypothetical protein